MLFKLKQTFFIILSLIILNACQTRWAADSFIKPKSSKQQIQKDKEKEKRKREYQLQVEKDRERNYNRQATSTKITWDKNAERSERWRKNEFQNKSFGSRIRAFFDRFKREAKPDSDLFSKEISKRNSKKKWARLTFSINRLAAYKIFRPVIFSGKTDCDWSASAKFFNPLRGAHVPWGC